MIRIKGLRPVAILVALAVLSVSFIIVALIPPSGVAAQGTYDGPTTAATGPAFFGPAPNPSSYCDNATYFPPLGGNVDPLAGAIDPGYTDTVSADGLDLTFTLTGEGVAGDVYPGFYPGTDQPKGVEMQQGDTATVTLSQPLFYSQWVFTDVDRVSEGFDVVPQWSGGVIGEAAAYGGDPNFTFNVTNTLVEFDDTDATAQPSEALAGRVQVDFLGAVDGITMARTPGSSGQSGFAAGGGCEALGSAKQIVSGPTWNGTGYDVVYEIRVRNNLPTTAVIQSVAAGADATSGPLEGIDLTNLSIVDVLDSTGFSSVSVVASNPTGGLDLNGGYDGIGVTELLNPGASVAPSTEELIVITAEYVPDLTSAAFNDCTATYEIGNQATISGTADGVPVTDLTDDGINAVPGDGNGNGAFEDITVVGFPCVAELEIVKTVVAGPNGTCPADFAAGIPGDGPALPVNPGDTATYCITVLNSGPGLAGTVNVTDPQAPAGFWTVQDIAAGAEASASYDLPITLDGPPAQNTATATGTGPDGATLGPVSDTALIDPPIAAPGLSIVKTVVAGPNGACPAFADGVPDDGPALPADIGDTVTYCITVLNSGNGDLTDVVVADAQAPAGFDGTVGALAVGAESTVSFDLVVDLDTPAQNTATANGLFNGTAVPEVDDTALIAPPVPAPSLAIVKTVVAGPNGACPAFADGVVDLGPALAVDLGDVVTYCVSVLNDGNVDLTTVTISDPQAPADFGAVGALAVGEEVTASYDITVALDTPPVNTAEATGSDADGNNTPVVTDPAQIDPPDADPSLAIVKTVLAGPNATCPAFADGVVGDGTPLTVDVGDTVTYCVSVLNDGNVDLTDVTITDAQAPAGFGAIGNLAINAEATDSYDVVITDTTPAMNIASVSGQAPDGPVGPVTDPALIDPIIQIPAIDIVKTVVAGPGGVCPAFAAGVAGLGTALDVELGDTVTYCVSVLNTGNTDLTAVTLSDPQAPAGWGTIGLLAEGNEATDSYDVVITLDTPATNTATVNASDPLGVPLPEVSDPAQIDPPPGLASLEIVKTVLLGPDAVCPAFDAGVAGLGTALPVNEGDVVTYCVAVRNPGNAPVTDVSITDPQAPADFAAGITTVAAGEEVSLSYDLIVVAGIPMVNTATANGTGPNGPVPTVTDPAQIDPTFNAPAIAIVKTVVAGPAGTCPAFGAGVAGLGAALEAELGDTVTYCVSVLNTGNTDLTDVTLTDPQAPAGWGAIGLLAEGNEATDSYDVVVAIDTPATNIATVNANDPVGVPLTPQEDPAQILVDPGVPLLQIVKTVVAGPGGTCPAFADGVAGLGTSLDAELGDVVTYCVSVLNAGTAVITDVVITDPQAPAGFGTVGTLAVGAEVTDSYDITITLDTPATNVASATGNGPEGPLPEVSDPAMIDPPPTVAQLQVVKTVLAGPGATCPSFSAGEFGIGAPLSVDIGDTVTYCIAVRNPGNVPITDVVLTDPQAPAGFGQIGTLAPLGEATDSYDVTITVTTPTTNTVAANGNGPDGPVPETTDPAIIAPVPQVPGYDVVKTALPGPNATCPTFADGVAGLGAAVPAPLGSTVTYCVTVVNTGNVDLTNAAVADAQAPAGFWTIGDLPIGAEVSNSYDIVVTVDTPTTNTASLTVDGPDGPLPGITDPALIDPEPAAPAFDIVKTVVAGPSGTCPETFADGVVGPGPALTVANGDVVTYCVNVINLGNVDLVSTEVSDAQAPIGFWTIGTLPVGEEAVNSYDITVTSATVPTNTATLNAEDGSGNPLTPVSDDAILDRTNPSYDVIKSVVAGPAGTCPSFADAVRGIGAPLDIALFDTATYCVIVQNTGDVDLTDVSVTDSQAPDGFWTQSTIAVGGEVSVSYDLVVTPDTPVLNTAVLTGSGPDGPLPAVQDPAGINPPDPSPDFEVVKTVVAGPAGDCPSFDDATFGAGEPIAVLRGATATYCVTVVNTGNVPLTNVAVSDPQAPAGFWTIGDLAVGAEVTNSYDLVVTPTTPEENVATVTAQGPGGEELPPKSDPSLISPPPAEADLAVTKSTSATVLGAGGTATYTVVVENLGPDPEPAAVFTDTLPTGVQLVAVPELDGWTCTEAGNVITCAKDAAFAVNQPDEFTYDVTVVTTATNASLTNAVEITGELPDPNPDNNKDETTFRTPPPDPVIPVAPPQEFGPPATAMPDTTIRTPLAVTGAESFDLVLLGLGLLLAGFGAVLVSRRRFAEE